MTGNATVFVIDDDTAVRESLTLLLEQEALTVKTFESAEAFLASSPSVRHSCAIVDIRMTGMDGTQLQAELLRRNIQLPILFLTGYGNIPLSVLSIKAGAVDFLTKPITAALLLKSVRVALLESEGIGMQAAENQAACIRLSRQLGISHRTVEIHKARVLHKTGTETLFDLARIADACGLRHS